jgi:hypothetical protein
VYFPDTAISWHYWWANSTLAFVPGWAENVSTPIMEAPLFVKGGTPIQFHQSSSSSGTVSGDAMDVVGPLELRVWAPVRAPSATHGDHTATQADATHQPTHWACTPQHVKQTGLYDDDGTTTNYKTHSEFWRAHAGFGVECGEEGTLLMMVQFEPETPDPDATVHLPPYVGVRWDVRTGMHGAPAHVSCKGVGLLVHHADDATTSEGLSSTSDGADVERTRGWWSFTPTNNQVHVSLPTLEAHSCTLQW